MFVNYIYISIIFPFRIICSPCDDITYNMHLRIFRKYSIAEFHITVVVMVALVLYARLVVLVADFNIFDVKRLRMSVLRSHLSIFCSYITVGILQSLHALVYPWLDGVNRSETTMP